MNKIGSKFLGRTFLVLGIGLLIMLFCWEVFGDEISIIEVRKNIPLADSEVVYRDFYINAGRGQGLKKNLVITAMRKMSVKDATGANSFGEMEIPVGQLKIIALNDKVAVAREYKLISREAEATLEQAGLMIGDRIDLGDSFVDSKKSK